MTMTTKRAAKFYMQDKITKYNKHFYELAFKKKKIYYIYILLETIYTINQLKIFEIFKGILIN